MKYVRIGNLEFSRIICGTNPFYGHSHFSSSRNTEYLRHFDDDAIGRTLQACINLGINTVESCANERILSILNTLRDRNRLPLRFIGSTRIDETSDLKTHRKKLSFLIREQADICVIHAQFVDRPRGADSITGLDKFIDDIHSAGLIAGVSTHRIHTVNICEKMDYGVDVYLFPLNISGFVYPGYCGTETVDERVALVQNTEKPFILIKTLGAGRIPPDEGLHFIFEHMKHTDLVSIGFGSEDEVRETVELAESLLQ